MGLDTAKMYKGRAIVAYNKDGQALDADGAIIEGAPKPAKDTEPAEQLGGRADMNAEERSAAIMANAFAKAMAMASGTIPTPSTDETDDDTDESEEDAEKDGFPNLDEMPAYVESLTTVEAVKDAQKRDKRKGAKQLYKDRLAALSA